jgi:succinate dehydrogenase / fumarate reductase cytochrome b subunit
MLSWIVKALESSVGKKIVMGLTGVLLVLFLLEHLVGNLFLYFGTEAAPFGPFDAYVDALKKVGPLLPVLEVALGLLFVIHAIYAIRVTLQNREARKQKYVVRGDRGGQTVGSVSMIYTGLAILVFLVVHLINFRFDQDFDEEHGLTVAHTLSSPPLALFYLAIMAVVGVHLSHGVQSALQSLGVHHPRWTVCLRRAGITIAVLFALAFASFPIYYLVFWTEGGAH